MDGAEDMENIGTFDSSGAFMSMRVCLLHIFTSGVNLHNKANPVQGKMFSMLSMYIIMTHFLRFYQCLWHILRRLRTMLELKHLLNFVCQLSRPTITLTCKFGTY